MASVQDDRIYPLTRIVAAIVVPFLALAFIILYFFPELSGSRFAWSIQPNMTAMFMGAGYIGGSWLFANAVFGRRWHRVAPGFAPVTAFTVAMLLTTVLHWDRFDLGHLPFILWLGLYVVTPFLVPLVWLTNRRADSGAPEVGDMQTPVAARWGLRLLGLVILVFAVVGFLQPAWLISVWAWKLTPLTARIMSGWFVLLGVGGLVIGQETRWSSWRVGLQAIGLWQLLVVIAALMNPADFDGGLLNWYLVSVILVLAGMISLYGLMEWQRRRRGAAIQES
jgi:hypothetical protein